MDARGEQRRRHPWLARVFRLGRVPVETADSGTAETAVGRVDDPNARRPDGARSAELAAPPDADVQLVLAACDARLREHEAWSTPEGYPNSLALAVLDGIWAMIARYAITRGVVTRYVASRKRQGVDAYADGISDLLAEYDRCGGIEAFIEQIGTQNKVSTQPGAATKGEAVHLAALAFRDLGVETAQDFRDAQGTPFGETLEERWRSLPGQRSGISWRYLRMLLGLEDVKPDRMVTAFLRDALGREVSTSEAVVLVRAAAARLDVSERALDHEIWEYQSGRTGAHDPLTREDYLRDIAHAFLASAFAGLKEAGVIPTSRYQLDWFLQVGRDYDGGDVMGPEAEALESALKTLYPDRFDEPLRRQEPEFPGGYIHRFVEAAIVRCSRFDEYDPDGPEAVETVDELIAVLNADQATVYACRAMSNLSTVGADAVEIGEVTVFPEVERFGGMMRQAISFVPSGPGAFNHEDPRPYDPPHALLVASTKVERGKAAWKSESAAIAKLDRFVFLARLLKIGTQQSMWELAGASTMVSEATPRYRVFDGSGMPNMRMKRDVAMRPEDAPAFEALGRLVDEAVVHREGMVSTSFDLGADLFNRSFEPSTWAERMTDLATALEAALVGGDTSRWNITRKLRDRSSLLLATTDDLAGTISADVNTLYDLRSSLVHGSSISETELRRTLETVSTVPAGEMFGVILDFAVDRLRDLVRRAFLARLCLSRLPDPLWPLEGGVDVDRELANLETAREWRERWQQLLADLGVGEAAQRATPAVDPLDVNHEPS
jgi:hypothetical protein